MVVSNMNQFWTEFIVPLDFLAGREIIRQQKLEAIHYFSLAKGMI